MNRAGGQRMRPRNIEGCVGGKRTICSLASASKDLGIEGGLGLSWNDFKACGRENFLGKECVLTFQQPLPLSQNGARRSVPFFTLHARCWCAGVGSGLESKTCDLLH